MQIAPQWARLTVKAKPRGDCYIAVDRKADPPIERALAAIRSVKSINEERLSQRQGQRQRMPTASHPGTLAPPLESASRDAATLGGLGVRPATLCILTSAR